MLSYFQNSYGPRVPSGAKFLLVQSFHRSTSFLISEVPTVIVFVLSSQVSTSAVVALPVLTMVDAPADDVDATGVVVDATIVVVPV